MLNIVSFNSSSCFLSAATVFRGWGGAVGGGGREVEKIKKENFWNLTIEEN